MTSHVDYIAGQDVEQLEHLIEVSKARVADLTLGGFVWLWVVADHSNRGWFARDDYAGAVALLCKLAQQYSAGGKPSELSIEDHQYRAVEAARLVAETKAGK
jgi:hypothetical protein